MDHIEDCDKYISEWIRTQILIWREKVETQGIIHSKELWSSFAHEVSASAEGREILLRFARHGIWQELGVGNGYYSKEKGNYGDLEFLDPAYRKQHGLDKPRSAGRVVDRYMTSGKPRERREWFHKKLYMSVMAMVEDMALITADDGARVICESLEDVRKTVR